MIDPALVIRQSDAWTWSLFPNQSYLGRVQFTLRRPCEGSLAQLTPNEIAEFHADLGLFEARLQEAFAPDRFNYVQLGNVWPQHHVHGIPRYAEPRQWNGCSVRDENWGGLPLPEPACPLGDEGVARMVPFMRELFTGSSAHVSGNH